MIDSKQPTDSTPELPDPLNEIVRQSADLTTRVGSENYEGFFGYLHREAEATRVIGLVVGSPVTGTVADKDYVNDVLEQEEWVDLTPRQRDAFVSLQEARQQVLRGAEQHFFVGRDLLAFLGQRHPGQLRHFADIIEESIETPPDKLTKSMQMMRRSYELGRFTGRNILLVETDGETQAIHVDGRGGREPLVLLPDDKGANRAAFTYLDLAMRYLLEPAESKDKKIISVEDTKDPEAGMLFFPREQFGSLVRGIKTGGFDHLS